jgi:hypothetical protein
MRKFLIPTIASLVMLGASPVWAWSHVSGSINSIDPKTREITLDNGTTYKVQAGVKFANLAVGDKVTVNTETLKGKNLVNKVTKTS